MEVKRFWVLIAEIYKTLKITRNDGVGENASFLHVNYPISSTISYSLDSIF